MSNYSGRDWPVPAPSGPPQRAVLVTAVLLTLVVLAVVIMIVVGSNVAVGADGGCGGG